MSRLVSIGWFGLRYGSLHESKHALTSRFNARYMPLKRVKPDFGYPVRLMSIATLRCCAAVRGRAASHI